MGTAGFTPLTGGAKISATSTSSSTAIPLNGDKLRVHNEGAAEVFIRIGEGSQTAVVDTDLYVAVGQSVLLCKANNPTTQWQIGAICNAAETATVFITAGYGDNIL